MEAVICDESALEYWRKNSDPLGGVASYYQLEPRRKSSVHIDTPSTSSVADLASWLILDPADIHLLVTASSERRAIPGISFTTCKGPFPTGSFARTRGQMYATVPELTFLLLARKLELVELLEVGYELCGTYRMGAEAPRYGFEPLTSVSRLRAYANRASEIPGSRKALQACQWLLDGSASPAETALAIVFKLPYRLGGCGLRNFALNHEIKLNQAAAHIIGRQTMHPDIYFLQAKHPVEYDGAMFHSSKEQVEYDQRRRNAYDAMGMGVTVLSSQHLVDFGLFDEMVRAIRRNTGQRQNRVPADYGSLQSDLLNEAFRYWIGLRSEYGTGREFRIRSAGWAEPDSPW